MKRIKVTFDTQRNILRFECDCGHVDEVPVELPEFLFTCARCQTTLEIKEQPCE